MKFEPFKRYLPVLVLLVMILAGLWLIPDAPGPAAAPPAGAARPQPVEPAPAALPAHAAEPGLGEPAAAEQPARPVEPELIDTSPIEYGWMLLKLFLILAGICGVAWLSLRWILPRLYGSQGGEVRHIKVLEHYRLDNHRSLFLVSVAGESVLLAASERGIHFLTRVEADLAAAAAVPAVAEAAAAPAPAPGRAPSFIEVLLRKKP
jgi:pyruvate dehydrogenase E2 component (dihydrolipoamide acetyltransferase)